MESLKKIVERSINRFDKTEKFGQLTMLNPIQRLVLTFQGREIHAVHQRVWRRV